MILLHVMCSSQFTLGEKCNAGHHVEVLAAMSVKWFSFHTLNQTEICTLKYRFRNFLLLLTEVGKKESR